MPRTKKDILKDIAKIIVNVKPHAQCNTPEDRAFFLLDPKDRFILEAIYIKGLTIEETANHYDREYQTKKPINEKTIRLRRDKALKHFYMLYTKQRYIQLEELIRSDQEDKRPPL